MFTSEKITIDDLDDVTDPVVKSQISDKFIYFRKLKGDNLFEGIVLNYFENICLLGNESLIKYHEDLLKNNDLLKLRDKHIKTSLKHFLSMPNLQIIEKIKNFFNHFVSYFRKIMEYHLAKKKSDQA
jgi:hypothetical protein